MTAIEIGITKAGSAISLPVSKANRHGLVTGSTGIGNRGNADRLVGVGADLEGLVGKGAVEQGEPVE